MLLCQLNSQHLAFLKWWKFATGEVKALSFPDSSFCERVYKEWGHMVPHWHWNLYRWVILACLNCQHDFLVSYSVGWLTGMSILGGQGIFQTNCCGWLLLWSAFLYRLFVQAYLGRRRGSFKAGSINGRTKISTSCRHGVLYHFFLTGSECAVSYTCNFVHSPRIKATLM